MRARRGRRCYLLEDVLLAAQQRLASPAFLDRGWELCRLSAACYRAALDRLYAHWRSRKVAMTKSELLAVMAAEDDPAFRALLAQSGQASAGQASDDYENALKARAAWMRDRSRFTGKPRMPGSKGKYALLTISNQQFKEKDGMIRFAPGLKLPPVPYPRHIPPAAKLMSIELRPEGRSLHLDIAYETEPATLKERRERERAWAKENDLRQKQDSRGQRLILDLNVNGVAVMDDTPRGKLAGMVINLRPLKSRIALANRTLTNIQRDGHQHAKRAMNDHRSKLNRHTLHFMHCVANDVIERALASGANYVLVGKNDGWKQKVNLGRRSNRRFCGMPLAKLVTLLGYKCRRAGLWLQETEEAYTSKIDHLAGEPMQRPANGRFLGRRVHRGLFRSSTGRVIHADLNGCIGIGRKVSGDRWLAEAILPVARKGARLAPLGTVVASGLAAMPTRNLASGLMAAA